jgi:type IV secretion system protein TrbE
VTATVVVMDVDPMAADEKRKAIERVIQCRDFVTIAESFNAVEAWLASIPGHVYANVRESLISTLSLAHLMALHGEPGGLPARRSVAVATVFPKGNGSVRAQPR